MAIAAGVACPSQLEQHRGAHRSAGVLGKVERLERALEVAGGLLVREMLERADAGAPA